jgi:hypothetical protein
MPALYVIELLIQLPGLAGVHVKEADACFSVINGIRRRRRRPDGGTGDASPWTAIARVKLVEYSRRSAGGSSPFLSTCFDRIDGNDDGCLRTLYAAMAST